LEQKTQRNSSKDRNFTHCQAFIRRRIYWKTEGGTEKRGNLIYQTMNHQANHATQAIRMFVPFGSTEKPWTIKSGNTCSGWHGELG